MLYGPSADTSKSIYLNATLEKITLIRLLKQREIRMATLMDDWTDSLTVRLHSFRDLSEVVNVLIRCRISIRSQATFALSYPSPTNIFIT